MTGGGEREIDDEGAFAIVLEIGEVEEGPLGHLPEVAPIAGEEDTSVRAACFEGYPSPGAPFPLVLVEAPFSSR